MHVMHVQRPLGIVVGQAGASGTVMGVRLDVKAQQVLIMELAVLTQINHLVSLNTIVIGNQAQVIVTMILAVVTQAQVVVIMMVYANLERLSKGVRLIVHKAGQLKNNVATGIVAQEKTVVRVRVTVEDQSVGAMRQMVIHTNVTLRQTAMGKGTTGVQRILRAIQTVLYVL
jgi:hypothetical protein